jgi:hypothetical protein
LAILAHLVAQQRQHLARQYSSISAALSGG